MIIWNIKKTLRLALDSLWNCPEYFSKEDLVEELSKAFDVKDIDSLIKYFLDIHLLCKCDGLYKITLDRYLLK